MKILNFWTKIIRRKIIFLILKGKDGKSPSNSTYSNSASTINFDFLEQIYPKKEFFRSKTKNEHHIESFMFELPNFSLKWQFWLCGSNFSKKGISGLKQHHHWLMHMRITLGTKLQFKLTILNFWTKFAQKWYFQSKAENMNITIKLCIFELV